ncbi:hypothetical protein B9Z19DRAFT_1094022 [Tuber borchii]|uniref:Uncharacterized protein n=1 Tax=Tuber borchii TaxID=42251 RepID=A0A2T6ZEM6_TUBBO|nr:hypothetical protein B9Z19DRAFT_1094022 [Tuber borchii]
MSSRLFFRQAIQPASHLCHRRTPYFRASVLRTFSNMNTTESPNFEKQTKNDKLAEPDTVQGMIQKLEQDIAIESASTNVTTTNGTQFENLTATRLKWMFGFGVGTFLLGVFGTILKVGYYDSLRDQQMVAHIEDTSRNLELDMQSKFAALQQVTILKTDHLGNKLDTGLGGGGSNSTKKLD